MKNQTFPEDKSHVTFTDQHGDEHTGTYVAGLGGYVEQADADLLLEDQYVYPQDQVISWQYVEDKDKPNSDFMVIL